jgi:AcrR family transcriptional regulator
MAKNIPAETRAPEDERRAPQQDRSKQRVTRILDAAAQLFTEAGYEATTTEAIAARAETSIGSIYQFFPNKRAVFDAVAERYFDEARQLYDALSATQGDDAPLDVLVGQAVDGFLALQAHAGFQAIWRNWLSSPEVFATGVRVNQELAKRTEAVLARRAKGVPPRRRPLVATMIVEVMSAVLLVSARKDEDPEEVAAEAKTILERYLAPYVSPK